MQKYASVAQDTMGNALAGATVAVYPAGTLSLATLYSDNLFTALAQPLTTGTDGTFDFYAQNGRYDIVITKVGYTFNPAQSYDIVLYDASSSVTPPQISTNVNDYSPTNALNMTIWRLSSDTDGRTITGIAAGNSGQRVTLENAGSFTILLANQSVSSLAQNRFVTGTSATINLAPGGSIEILYDSTLLRWIIISTSAYGIWIPVSFSASNFVSQGLGGSTWTVTSTRVNRYTVIGKTLFWQLDLTGGGGAVAAANTAYLKCFMPGGYLAANNLDSPALQLTDSSTYSSCFYEVQAGVGAVFFLQVPQTNFLSGHSYTVSSLMTIEVQ